MCSLAGSDERLDLALGLGKEILVVLVLIHPRLEGDLVGHDVGAVEDFFEFRLLIGREVLIERLHAAELLVLHLIEPVEGLLDGGAGLSGASALLVLDFDVSHL